MILVSTFLPSEARAWNPLLWDVQPQRQAEEPLNVNLGRPAGVHYVDRPDSPTPPRSLVSLEIDDSEAVEQRAQRQSSLPSPVHSRPLPSPPLPTRGSYGAQRQSVLPSPTYSTPLPPLPFSTHGSHYP
jgi:hypothetical protein